MRTLKLDRPSLAKGWRYVTGNPAEFSLEERSFNGICILSLAILLFLLPFNAILGLWKVCSMMGLLIAADVFFYYQARIRHRYTLTIVGYAVVSYATLATNYFFNSGSLGPTLFLFFLTFQLLIAFSKRHLHIIWFICHLLVAAALLVVELWFPSWVPDTYTNKAGRFTDLVSSYLIILVCMYLITIYLRNNYNKERKVAEERAGRISEQNRQLEQMNVQKSKLFSIMAHDLRGPFHSITQVVDMLDNKSLSQEDQDLFIRHLKEFTTSTSDMLGNLLSWSYSQMQGVKVHLENIPVKKVVDVVLYVQRNLATKKDISIYIDVEETHGVLADYNMLEIVIRNLVNNAIKFTPKGGSIHIISSVEEGMCRISVQDNGTGISEEMASDLFTFNLASTRGTANEKGIGLGLTLCKDFINLQNGRIEVESVIGKGSVFIVLLPASTEEISHP